jgi:hypothetical protein
LLFVARIDLMAMLRVLVIAPMATTILRNDSDAMQCTRVVLCLQIVPSVLRCLWWYHERRMWWQATEAMSVEVGAMKTPGKRIYQ